MKNAEIEIIGQIGRCGDREVFMGFEKASLLHKLSFADIFDENTGAGYQRRFNRDHSMSFKRYINNDGATTIPLTFNLRPERSLNWEVIRSTEHPGFAILRISSSNFPIMAQVDCQHRLGYLNDSPIQFAFMAYLGLEVNAEMEIFRDINGKAKGLSSSLLDVTEAKLTGDRLLTVNPALYYAMQLCEREKSPWYQKLDLGGKANVGTKRTASLRTMQQAMRRFLKGAHVELLTSDEVTDILINYWSAIVYLLKDSWDNPRRHLLNKSIGVYSLMSIAGDLVSEAIAQNIKCDQDYFIGKLSDFIHKIDWSSSGILKGYGGVSGADAAVEMIRHTRKISTQGSYGKQEYSFN
jgi:DNA sulfur modification protein DndB